MLRKYILRRARYRMASRKPDFQVINGNGVYLQRWWIIPRNRWFNIYLHRFLHDDEDSALHDHPYASMSWVLDRGYYEHSRTSIDWQPAGAIVFRRAATAHRIELKKRHELTRTGWEAETPIPAVSLFFTGPRTREWGFHCPNGWVPWFEFVDDRDKGRVGKGCGE